MDQIKRKNLTKKKISDTLHEKIGHSQIFFEKFIDNVFEIVAHSLLSHQEVKIKNFGSFKLLKKNKRIGRNPKNSEAVSIPEKNSIKWKMSKTFFSRLNKNFTEIKTY